MTRTEAINIYLEKHKKTNNTINMLVSWDETKTLKQNGESLGIKHSHAYHLATFFKLKYIHIQRGKKIDMQLRQKVLTLRAEGKTLEEIGTILGSSKQNISRICRRENIK